MRTGLTYFVYFINISMSRTIGLSKSADSFNASSTLSIICSSFVLKYKTFYTGFPKKKLSMVIYAFCTIFCLSMYTDNLCVLETKKTYFNVDNKTFCRVLSLTNKWIIHRKFSQNRFIDKFARKKL